MEEKPDEAEGLVEDGTKIYLGGKTVKKGLSLICAAILFFTSLAPVYAGGKGNCCGTQQQIRSRDRSCVSQQDTNQAGQQVKQKKQYQKRQKKQSSQMQNRSNPR